MSIFFKKSEIKVHIQTVYRVMKCWCLLKICQVEVPTLERFLMLLMLMGHNFHTEHDRLSKLTATCFGQHGLTACVWWEEWWGLSYSVLLVAQSESIVLF